MDVVFYISEEVGGKGWFKRFPWRNRQLISFFSMLLCKLLISYLQHIKVTYLQNACLDSIAERYQVSRRLIGGYHPLASPPYR